MIAIPNMSKPKNCKECQWHLDFYIEDKQVGGLCTITEKDDKENTCPLIEIVTCAECKHKPTKYDPEGDEFGFNLVSPNGYDNLCPCLNTDDGFYSYMPEDNFFCAFGERRE